MPSAVLIVNSASGAHLEGSTSTEMVCAGLESSGITVEVLKGTIREQIAASLKSDADMVIVDGGDGTINATITAHSSGDKPIGIVPGGTMNFLAQDFGIPVDREAAVAVIGAGHTRPVDVGTIGKFIFLHTAATGFPVRLGVHREKRRGRFRILDKARLVFHALSTVRRDPRLTLASEGDNGSEAPITSPTFAFVVGTFTGHFLPRPHRDVASGELTAFAIDPKSGLDLVRLFLRGAFGEVANDPDVARMVIRGGELSGRRRRIHAMLDGESVLITLPCRIGLRPGAVRIFAPAGSDG